MLVPAARFDTVKPMLRFIVIVAAVSLALELSAAEKEFDFSKFPMGQAPKGFRSAVSGQGHPGDWKIVLDEVPSQIKPLSAHALVTARQPVLAQLADDPTDEHFPMLIYDEETYRDFTLTTRFKTVAGSVEQMAGI